MEMQLSACKEEEEEETVQGADKPMGDPPPNYTHPVNRCQPPSQTQQYQPPPPPQWGYPPPQWGYPPPVVMQPPQSIAMQPQQTSNNNNTVVINQQNQQQQPAVKTLRAWSTGVCGCFDDMGVCCCVFFCGPCAECQLSMDMGEHCCVPLCVPWSLITLRAVLRTEHKIQGGVCNDCCTVCCCYHCVLCQMKRELKVTKGQALYP
ncbi:PLAC8-like protein 1 [Pomacea canaliculata]|uniref:PLAC8-like protein 1 n=1 Tax=Pomacea canaliculata TaxID=400727 RepID=UPI000D7295A0|nr:PLAC8-like protein 1 [Pomacea canaliculata]